MSKPPVLKPREVARLLEALQFREVRRRGSIDNIAMRMEDRRPFHFTKEEIFPRFCFGKSQKTSD